MQVVAALPAVLAGVLQAEQALRGELREDLVGKPLLLLPLLCVGGQFALEEGVRCRFGSPIAGGDRASVEWWASWVEGGREVTLAGATILRFDGEGRVVEHVDYWVEGEGQTEPFAGWGS